MPDEPPPPPPPDDVPDAIDPATASLEWNCEEVFKRLLACAESLAPIAARHYGTKMAAAVDVLVVKAERGAKRLDGFEGYDVKVTVLYSTSTKTVTELDALVKNVVDSIYLNPQSPALDLSDLPFEGFCIEPGMTSKREDLTNTRKITVEVPVIAKLVS